MPQNRVFRDEQGPDENDKVKFRHGAVHFGVKVAARHKGLAVDVV